MNGGFGRQACLTAGREKTMSDTEVKNKTCTTPGCKKPAKAWRGLCYTCSAYLHNGTDEDHKALIRKHMLPSKRESKAAAGQSRPRCTIAAPPSPAPQAAPAAPSDLPTGDDNEPKAADEVIATCCEVCTVLGMERINVPGGRVFVDPHTARAAELTDEGLVYRNELRRIAS